MNCHGPQKRAIQVKLVVIATGILAHFLFLAVAH
jgi:hypothetical protein